MTPDQILAHCYMLGRMAFERGKLRMAPEDNDFRDFYHATLKGADTELRFDGFDNWYAGYDAAKKEASE